MNKTGKILIALLGAVVLVEGAVLLSGKTDALSNDVGASSTLAEYANRVVAKCKKDQYRPACYDKEIPKLMDYISMEDAFKVTALVQQNDTGYQYCHVLGHELSAREVVKDPSKWKEIIARCPSGMCSNGCIHGGFQERFRTESFSTDAEVEAIKPDLAMVCEARGAFNPTGLEQASCYHAIGHLNMYITNADLPKANKLCREIALKSDGRNYLQVCFDGTFMQIFQPLEPEDFALIEGKQPKKEEIPTFCGKFTGEERGSCFSESWPLFGEEIKKPAGLVKFCDMNPETSDRCMIGMFYVLTAQFNFDLKKVTDLCSGLPENRRGQCFGGSATRLIETDYKNIEKSVSLCKIGEPFDPSGVCYQNLVQYSTFNFHPKSPQFFEMCNALPDAWQSKCLAK